MRKILIVLLLLVVTLPAAALYSVTKLYVYGFAMTFNDSTVYFTDVLELDSAWYDSHHKFIYSRSSYSSQLKTYLQDEGVDNPTCIIAFADNRKKAEKKLMKMKSKYMKKNTFFTIRYVAATDFVFTAVSAADDPAVPKVTTKEELKAARKAEKEADRKAKEERAALKGRGAIANPGQGGRPQGPPPGGGGGPR